jgi:uncharacterized phiE125 gp8 family phage protein
MAAICPLPPAAEPWSLAEAKLFLRVEHDDDDAVISALIAAARSHIEALTRLMLLTQTWRRVRDAWPADGRLNPRIGPLRALIAARVFDAAGHASALDVESFVVDVAANVIAAPCWALPVPGRDVAGIELDVELGFGPLPTDVPDALRHAVRLLVAHWYENRGMAATGAGVAMLPSGASRAVEADADSASVRERILLRGNFALTLQHRLVDGAKIYRIVSLRDIDDRRFIEIDAELRVE